METGTLHFTEKELATNSPLAQELFKLEQVKGVFLGSDFVTVTKDEEVEWQILKPLVLTTLMDFFVSGQPTTVGEMSSADNSNDDDITKQIKEILDSRVRPAVAMDGGDIIFHSFNDGVLKLELHGSCSGCPSSIATLKQGVENMMKYYVPEVETVEAVDC